MIIMVRIVKIKENTNEKENNEVERRQVDRRKINVRRLNIEISSWLSIKMPIRLYPNNIIIGPATDSDSDSGISEGTLLDSPKIHINKS